MREADFASIERIGVGQFATVHSSRVSGGKFAAVKIWHRPVAITDANDLPSGSDYDEPLPIDLADIACFAQEVALLASSDLAHPNVVKYLGHGFVPIPGTNRVRGFVAMELVEVPCPPAAPAAPTRARALLRRRAPTRLARTGYGAAAGARRLL